MPTSDRDELANLVNEAYWARWGGAVLMPPSSGDRQSADMILAAGYRKARTIATVEELDALPVGSVILDSDGDAWQRSTSGWTCTDRAFNTVDQPSENLVNILGPATVIWEPLA